MLQDLQSFTWAYVVFAGALVLGAGIAYGMWRNSKRTRAEKRLTEEATRAEYKSEDA